MSGASEALVAGLLVVGALFVLLGSIGLARLPDFMARLHGPTKATTLGVGSLLLASAIHFSDVGAGRLSLHELAIAFFLFITAPVTAHLLAKAALHRRTPACRQTVDAPAGGSTVSRDSASGPAEPKSVVAPRKESDESRTK
jgi:multicomponent K+:H+ antiporter subunit G